MFERYDNYDSPVHMVKLKYVLGSIVLIYLSASNSFAGKFPWMTAAEYEEFERSTTSVIANMQDRNPYYQNAYRILENHRLIPVDALFWQCDTLPCGPVYEKNIFHFFWSRSLINAEMLVEGGCYISFVHPFICCADYGHGYAFSPTPYILWTNLWHRRVSGEIGKSSEAVRYRIQKSVDQRGYGDEECGHGGSKARHISADIVHMGARSRYS
jgi:hypothetical protein